MCSPRPLTLLVTPLLKALCNPKRRIMGMALSESKCTYFPETVGYFAHHITVFPIRISLASFFIARHKEKECFGKSYGFLPHDGDRK